ncbi:MAG: ABC transporter permease subunit [Armatimonadota bacterium]|nr:ABC transporter permease subunit [Armatimonadota bacterium]
MRTDGSRWLLRHAPWTYSVLPVLLLWEAVGRLGLFVFIPPLSQVTAAAISLAGGGQLWVEGLRTIGSVLVGFGLAAAAGTVLGVLMARHRLVEAAFGHYVDALQNIPAAATVPVLVLLLGLGRTSIATVTFVFAFPAITINVYAGVKHVDPRLVQMARSFGAGEWALVRRVILPAALPLALAGMRLGVGRAVNGAVLGEMMISSIGLGGLLMYYGGSFKVRELYALTLLVVGIAGTLMAIVQVAEKRAGRWIR